MTDKRELLENSILLTMLFLFLVTSILIAQEFTNSAVSILDTGASAILSALLVWFYSRQTETSETQAKILESQKDIMEFQKELSEIEYTPDLVYGMWDIEDSDPVEDREVRIKAPVYNRGDGEALNCKFGLYCKPVSDFESTWGDDKPRYGVIKADALSHNTNLSFRREGVSSAKPPDRLDSGEEALFLGRPSILQKVREDGYCKNAGWSTFFDESDITPGDDIVVAFRIDYQDKVGNNYTDVPFCVSVEYMAGKNIKQLIEAGSPLYYDLEDENDTMYYINQY
jgi:hypothetical protein